MNEKFHTKKFRGVAVAAAAFGVLISTAAVSSGAPQEASTAQGGFSTLVQTTIDDPETTQVEREVLKRAKVTGKIDASENKKAHLSYKKCMTDAGYSPKFRQSTKGFYVELPYEGIKDPDALNAALVDCSVGTSAVQALYRVQQANPNVMTDGRAVAVKCLTEQGIAGVGYTVEKFEQDYRADTFPFDAMEVEANDCLYGAGYAYFDLDK